MMAPVDRTGDLSSSPGALVGRLLGGELGNNLGALMPMALAFLDGGPDASYASVKQELRQKAMEDPIDTLLAIVVGGGLAFYLAERGHNPACATPLDGILYAATSLSVGYDNTFPVTPTGHALATLIQTFGPALATRAFDPPAAEVRAEAAAASEAAAVNRAILARLEDIVRLLETR
ncbi:MAG: potassium channel family protein [Deltaproteobacteria bacterium]|nr:potassium channel family protein [Deltaproteobacteria bacterium]